LNTNEFEKFRKIFCTIFIYNNRLSFNIIIHHWCQEKLHNSNLFIGLFQFIHNINRNILWKSNNDIFSKISTLYILLNHFHWIRNFCIVFYLNFTILSRFNNFLYFHSISFNHKLSIIIIFVLFTNCCKSIANILKKINYFSKFFWINFHNKFIIKLRNLQCFFLNIVKC
jgi:hypothetical protein